MPVADPKTPFFPSATERAMPFTRCVASPERVVAKNAFAFTETM